MASKETQVFHVVRFSFMYDVYLPDCPTDDIPQLEDVEDRPVLCRTCFDEWGQISGIKEADVSARFTHPIRDSGNGGSRMSRHIVVLIGPGGAGKTSLVKKAVACGLATSIVTCTTRSPRPDEIEGRDYYFLSSARFDQAFETGQLFEREPIHGYWYGTPVTGIVDALAQDTTALIAMGFVGASFVKTQWPQQVTCIFVMPPSIAALQQRLQRRGTDDQDLDTRLARARDDLTWVERADAIIHNDEFDQAFAELCAYLR